MDIIGRELAVVIAHFDSLQIPYSISTTRSDRCRHMIDSECLYIIRQRIDTNGICQLVVCGKMGREVLLHNGL